jgi:hypothetical protein
MSLWSIQLLREMITRKLPGVKERPERKADNLTAICESIVWKMWDPRRLTTRWASTACYRNSFTNTHIPSFFVDGTVITILTLLPLSDISKSEDH